MQGVVYHARRLAVCQRGNQRNSGQTKARRNDQVRLRPRGLSPRPMEACRWATQRQLRRMDRLLVKFNNTLTSPRRPLLLATFFESPGKELPPPQNNSNRHASVLQNTNFQQLIPLQRTYPAEHITPSSSSSQGPPAAETTPLSTATSVAEPSLLHFSSDSCTA